jgi:tetratricopeptide (TPR) repeat protein
MRLDFIRGMAIAGGVLFLPAAPAYADSAAELKLCLSVGTDYDADIEDACDTYIKSGAGKAADRAKAYFARARVVANDFDYDSAVEDMDNSIDLVATNDAYVHRSFYLIKLGEYDDAIKDATTVIKDDPGNADAFYLRGRASYENDDFDNALDDLDHAIKLAPEHADAYLWRGHLNADDFEIEAAIADYSKAIQYAPSADAYYGRAEMYYFDLKDREAIADLDEVLKLSPNDVEAHRLKAECLTGLEEYDQAIAEYDAVLRVNAKDNSALGARAAVFLTKGNAAAAISDYTDALAIKTEKGYYLGRARAYKAADDVEKAIADQKSAIGITPVANDYYQLALLYRQKDATADADAALTSALEAANKAIAANDNYGSNYADRGAIYRAKGQNDLALTSYDEAIKRASENVDYYLARAEVNDALGKPDAAAADRAKADEIKAKRDAEAAADFTDDDADPLEDTSSDDDSDAGSANKGGGAMRKLQ